MRRLAREDVGHGVDDESGEGADEMMCGCRPRSRLAFMRVDKERMKDGQGACVETTTMK